MSTCCVPERALVSPWQIRHEPKIREEALPFFIRITIRFHLYQLIPVLPSVADIRAVGYFRPS